ncbi:MAG: mechanosensitive ion channel family protein [Alphaproteobacteria bacterium]
MGQFLDTFGGLSFYGNSAVDWITALALAGVAFVVLMALRRFLVGRLEALARGDEEVPAKATVAAGLVRRVAGPFLLVVAAFAGAYVLDLPPRIRGAVGAVLSIALFLQLARLATYAFVTWLEVQAQRRLAEDPSARTALGAVSFVGQVAIWSVVLLLALDNLGFDVNALVAGFGIAGVAVAFAAQNILADLFASLSIILDKPFVVGDFIIVGDVLGTVERVGVKTTRLSSLTGEQVVMANNDLLASRIRNYGRMAQRRITFSIGVTYETQAEKLEAIPGMLREAVEAHEPVRFDRAHFKSYGDFAQIFEVVYYVLKPDYNLMMDIQQSINLAIRRRFDEEGIEFAYPTQTLYVHRANGEGA